MFAHLGVLVVLTLVSIVGPQREELLVLISSPTTPDDPLANSEEFDQSDLAQDMIGALGLGDSDALAPVAPTLDVLAVTPATIEVDDPPVVDEPIEIQEEIRIATDLSFSENLSIKGIAGVRVSGATGAIDRITQEIVLSLEVRKTLVVWLFDQSGSLERERAEIVERFDRVYEELGVIEARGNPAFEKHDDKPLLTAIVAFGREVSFLTPKPTDDVEAVKSAVAGIKTDASGVERTFSAVRGAAQRYRGFRTKEPRRNVLLVVFTDEVGDDESELDDTVALCRRYEIPVYCIGVPAPFGRREVLVRYVDPDPEFDQTPQWLPVRQGPESFMPELVRVGKAQNDRPMDSGFGPYSLTRLCYETEGIYFTVRPGPGDRRGAGGETGASAARLTGSLDAQVMLNYRPDYMPIKEYQRLLAKNKARAALVEAARMSWIAPIEQPALVFPKASDDELTGRLWRAQQVAAVLEPKISQLHEVLRQGEKDRPKLIKPRWQAGYDLSMGMLLAVKVRTETYGAMLAKARTGMKFTDAKSDTWRLVPADEVTIGSALEKIAAEAKTYLERVRREHPGTPWAALAEAELEQPFGWTWKEAYTGVKPRRQVAGADDRRQPRDDRVKTIPRPVKRPPPKL